MGRGSSAPSIDVPSPQEMHDFFSKKVDEVRNATSISPPVFPESQVSCCLSDFQPVSVDFISRIILRLPNKSSSLDPLPCRLLKSCVDLLAPFLTYLFNKSLCSGIFPEPWKRATVTPKMKKCKSNSADPASYRPISNLPLLSKILEKVVSAELRSYLQLNNLIPSLQSAYRPHHSTETSLLKTSSDIFQALDNGKVCLLAFIDLSAAFDTVDHATLLQKLNLFYGLRGSVLSWLRSFVSDRSMSVCSRSTVSSTSSVNCGVPQGSVLGPLLFMLYISGIIDIVKEHNFDAHLFADDIQVYASCDQSQASMLSSRLSLCLDDVVAWLNSHRLFLNAEKSEILWCSSRKRNFSSRDPIRIGSSYVTPSAFVRCLGAYLDSHMSFDVHVSRCVSACFCVLRQIRSIRRSLPRSLLTSLITALVISRIDYCISLLNGVSKSNMQRLQSVLNASARLIFSSSRFSSVSPYLRRLHFLPVKQMIEYRSVVLIHSILHRKTPAYLYSELQLLSEMKSRRNLRSATSSRLFQPPSRRPTLGGRAFPVAAAKIWNTLPSSITSLVNTTAFKKTAKAHFLEISFT
jgi:hypothetical protein